MGGKRVLHGLLCGGLAVIALGLAGLQPDPGEAEEPPLVGQPENFSGAVGKGLAVTVRAEPKEVQAEDPLTLTVRVSWKDGTAKVPRPDLRKVARLAKQFHVEDAAERKIPKENAVEFDYRLRPRTAAVKQIPGWPFVYYTPGIGYQTAYAKSIPLRVKPREAVQPPARPIQAPESVLRIETGAAVLQRQTPFRLPPAFVLVLLVLAPPALCAGWYAVWRMRNPDAARLAHRRRSRAARKALQELQAIQGTPPENQVLRAARIVADYLHQRFDLAAAEPTPTEVADHLNEAGCPAPIAEQAAAFFRACDSARFASDMSETAGLATAAETLILALEAEPWSSHLPGSPSSC